MLRALTKLVKVLCFCLPTSAGATPPDVIDVFDEVFGISPTHVFIMRTAVDNLGIYAASHTFIVLVGKEIETGRETIWPVYRVISMPDYKASDRGNISKTEVVPEPNGRNPYDILAEYGGEPASSGFSWYDTGLFERQYPSPEAVLTAETLTLSAKGSVTHQIKTDVLFEGMSASLSKLSDYAGEYWRFTTQITPSMMLEDRTFDYEMCRVTDPIKLVALDWKSGSATAR
ncbi:hypothetical protein [Halovulum sp. GXIMD14793]